MPVSVSARYSIYRFTVARAAWDIVDEAGGRNFGYSGDRVGCQLPVAAVLAKAGDLTAVCRASLVGS